MTVAAQGETINRATLLGRLRESREQYLRSLQGVGDEQAHFRQAGGAWCILEIAEHVATAERQMLALWMKLAAPGQSPRAKDAGVIAAQADRGTKRQAPERSVPNGRYTALADAVRDFETHRANTVSWLENNTDDLRTNVVEHPLAGTVDGVQLLLLMAGHCERHAEQISDIKAQDGYPK